MKRDDDLIREILLEIERDDEWVLLMPGLSMASEPEERRKLYHIELLRDNGFVTSVAKGTFRMTAQGHDYLDAIRDQGNWQKTKDAVAATGGNASLEIIKQLATGFLKKKISQHTGIEL